MDGWLYSNVTTQILPANARLCLQPQVGQSKVDDKVISQSMRTPLMHVVRLQLPIRTGACHANHQFILRLNRYVYCFATTSMFNTRISRFEYKV